MIHSQFAIDCFPPSSCIPSHTQTMAFRSFVLLAFVLVAAQAKLQLSFFGDHLAAKLVSGAPALSDNDQWVAQAEYSPASEHISNFGQYKVKTNGLFSDNAQTFAAGYLEGYLTAETIHQHYANMMCQVDCSGAVPPELKQFFAEQDLWTRQQVQKNPDSPYWNYVGTIAATQFVLRTCLIDIYISSI